MLRVNFICASICGYPHTVKGGNMWIDPQKRECYGKLFPNVRRLEANTPLSRAAEFTLDEAKWERCTQCPHYRTCYDLSMAVLALNHAVESN